MRILRRRVFFYFFFKERLGNIVINLKEIFFHNNRK